MVFQNNVTVRLMIHTDFYLLRYWLELLIVCVHIFSGFQKSISDTPLIALSI